MARVLTQKQKDASNKRAKAWRLKQLKDNPDGFRANNAKRAKRLYHRKPELAARQQANFKRSYNNNPEFRAKVVRSASVGRYLLTPAEYDAKLAHQNGHCALCESTDGDAGRRLHVDHNHDCCIIGPPKKRTCGRCNRGLLCGPCNRRLGALEEFLKDAEVMPRLGRGEWLRKALKYLEHWRGIHKRDAELYSNSLYECSRALMEANLAISGNMIMTNIQVPPGDGWMPESRYTDRNDF